VIYFGSGFRRGGVAQPVKLATPPFADAKPQSVSTRHTLPQICHLKYEVLAQFFGDFFSIVLLSKLWRKSRRRPE